MGTRRGFPLRWLDTPGFHPYLWSQCLYDFTGSASRLSPVGDSPDCEKGLDQDETLSVLHGPGRRRYSVRALPQALSRGKGEEGPLSRPRESRRQVLQPRLREPLCGSSGPDREKAFLSRPAVERVLLPRHGRMQPPVQVLPELGDLPGLARRRV